MTKAEREVLKCDRQLARLKAKRAAAKAAERARFARRNRKPRTARRLSLDDQIMHHVGMALWYVSAAMR